MDRRSTRRIATFLPIRIWGVDAKSQPFMQMAKVKNISAGGAVVQGLLRQVKPGETVHVQTGGGTAQFRVVWAGKTGLRRDGEIGIEALPSQPSIWDVNLSACAEFVGKG
jgi:hypothetical protein